MQFLRGFLAAALALGLGAPAFAQSPGYSAVFGSGSEPAGPGYSSVFGGSAKPRGYVSPLFEHNDDSERRLSLWDSSSRNPASSSLSTGVRTDNNSDQDFQFLDSLNGSHSAGSADFMSGIGVVSGSGNRAAFVDTLHRGVGYAARGANAYLSSLGGRGDIGDSFFDADGKMGMRKTASPLPADSSGVADLNAHLQNMMAPSYDTTDSSTQQNAAAYSQQNANRDVYRPSGAVNSAPSGYDMVFGQRSASGPPPSTDYVDPLSQVGGSSPSAGLNAGVSGTPAYGAYQSDALVGSGYLGSGSVRARDAGDPLAPSGSGAATGGSRPSGGNLIDTYGTAALRDPLAGYRLK